MINFHRAAARSTLALALLCPVASADDTRSDLLAQAASEFDAAQKIQQEQPDRARQLFLSAAQRYQSVMKTGVINGRLEYNIGNAYLQAADIGRAILHYRRAERLIPGDPLLADNLSLARSKRLTSIQASGHSELLRTLFFWHYETSLSSRLTAALALYVLCWLLLTIRNFQRRRGLTVAAVVCLLAAGLAGGSTAATSLADERTPAGVVLALDVPVYKGPGSTYQRQFAQPLQPGVEFTLRERRGQWWQIELLDGKTGWIDSAAAELIHTQTVKSLEVAAP